MAVASLAALRQSLAENCLAHLGSVAITPDDTLPLAQGSLLLIGPDEPRFWPLFSASDEYSDGQTDPLDRWSARVVGAIAARHDAVPLYPFGGPPWHPFIGWALRSGATYSSPVGLLVHAERGLFFSCRAALLVPWQVPRSATAVPCPTCAQPCKSACPVGAFGPDGYDAAACRAYVAGPRGADCRTNGCVVRRTCPVGAGLRLPVQSAFHMAAFAPRPKAPA